MKPKTFEKELPQGYRLEKSIDATEKKCGALLTLGSLLLMIPAVALWFLPVLLSPDEFFSKLSDGIPPVSLIFLVTTLLYLVLHELVHGIAYKAQTGEKLTFGMSWSCAYCGVPHIFTYRKTALIAVLAPFVLFTVLFLVLIPFTYASPWIYMTLALVFGLHVGGCVGDLYVRYLFLFKYKNPAALMNDTGPCMSFFLPTEDPTAEPDEATAAFLVKKENGEKKKSKTDKNGPVSPEKQALGRSIAGIILLILYAIPTAIIAFSQNGLRYPLYEKALYAQGSFWIFAVLVALIVWFAATLKKYAKRKSAILVAIIFLWLPCLIMGANSDKCSISVTKDIANYGAYDTHVQLSDRIPTAITEDMTPVAYSYYYDHSWDWCYEHCLEVKMTDASYADLKSAYADSLVPCWYANGYEEYVASDDLGSFDPTYTDHPNIEKIIFGDADNTVIYVTVYGIDPFYFENSYYFARFSLDPEEYYEKTTASTD